MSDGTVAALEVPEAIYDIVLRDGSTLALRRARESDAPAIVRFFEGLSRQSLYQRFLGFPTLDERKLSFLIAPDAAGGTALVGESSGKIVAFAGFYPSDRSGHRAEVAFAIADALQGRGIGTRLLERLADLARENGIRTFEAFVLGENHRMMDVFLESGYRITRRIEQGVVHVTLGLERTPDFVEKAALRAQHAATASMKPFFEPRTIAVVGANRNRGKIGAEILHNIRETGFTGTVVPVHPAATTIQGLQAFRCVTDIPGSVDLAVVAVPAAHVLAAVDDCLTKGVRGICVISAGFGEAGPEGRAQELQLLQKVRGAGCRLIGPNCMGLVNTDPAFALNATFSPVYPPVGKVAMSTQSGALGIAILDYARRHNIGISSFVSVGNKIDVSGNDLIQVLVGRSPDGRHPALPRKFRKPEEVQRDRATRRAHEAHRRGQVRAFVRRRPRRVVAYGRAGCQRRRRRRAVRAGRCHQDGHPRRALRRGRPPRAPTCSDWPACRDSHQRGGPGHPRG